MLHRASIKGASRHHLLLVELSQRVKAEWIATPHHGITKRATFVVFRVLWISSRPMQRHAPCRTLPNKAFKGRGLQEKNCVKGHPVRHCDYAMWNLCPLLQEAFEHMFLNNSINASLCIMSQCILWPSPHC